MIFVTIGTQEPFDRLIKLVDELAKDYNHEIIAQVFNSNYKSENLTIIDFVNPKEYENLFKKADLIISHAGMGSIISALSISKPIIVMPRKASLGEHRNEHQLATAKKMGAIEGVYVVNGKEDLKANMDFLLENKNEKVFKFSNMASQSLLASIKNYINSLN
ncbi:glycosyltransferase [Algibacter pacificus]|uniref:glycosyltransferase n=1 Tax=Algibacter pacificus TaxID=2599389 RepID=UPI0011CA0A77|nr:glycosyltransferase [Algibacter pacificus]